MHASDSPFRHVNAPAAPGSAGLTPRLLAFLRKGVRVAKTAGRSLLRPARTLMIAVLALGILSGCASVKMPDSAVGNPGYASTYEQRIDQMPLDDIRALTPEKQGDLLAALNAFPDGTYKDAAFERLFDHAPLDPAYKADQQMRLIAFQADFLTDPVMHQARDNWGQMNTYERLEVMQHLADKHASHMGHPPSSVLFSISEKDSKSGTVNIAYVKLNLNGKDWSGDNAPIYINIHDDASWDKFADTVGALMQESTHAYQGWLAHRWRNGKLDKTDPRHDQARIFWYNFLNYVNGDKDYGTYKNQPVERDGWDMTKRYEELAGKELKRQKLDSAGLVF